MNWRSSTPVPPRGARQQRWIYLTTRDTPGNVELQNDVTAALERSDGLDSALSVSAHEGVVTPAGSADDEVDVVAAQDLAEMCRG